MALLLVDYGADIEAKDSAGWTSLMVMALHGQSLEPHLERGAALCTHPLSVYSDDAAHGGKEREAWMSRSIAVGDARDYPCERGFYLRDGVNCTGITRCPAGSYCPGHLERTNARFPCPANTWSARVGLTSAAQCTPCPYERPVSAPGSDDESLCTTRIAAGRVRSFCRRDAALHSR